MLVQSKAANVQLELFSKGQVYIRRGESIDNKVKISRHAGFETEINVSGSNPLVEAVAPKKESFYVMQEQQHLSVDITSPGRPANGTVNNGVPLDVYNVDKANGTLIHGQEWSEQGKAELFTLVASEGLRCFNALLAVSACVLIYFSRIRSRPRSLQGGRRGLLGIESRFQFAIFLAYVAFSCTHMFLQRRAGSTGYSIISATIVIYAVKCACAFFMYVCNGGRDFSALLEPTGGPRFGRVPTCILTLIPGGCLGCYDALSFLSLAALDPVTYQIVLHMRLVLIALLWQITFQRQLTATQWFALVLFAVASTTKGIEQVKEFGLAVSRGLHIALIQIIMAVSGNVMAECLLKEVPVPTDLLNTCLYLQGLMVLLVVVCVTHGGPMAVQTALLAPQAWKDLISDPWMLSSIICMAMFGIVTAYFLRELSNLLKELSACFVIVSSAVVEWGLLGSSSCTMLGIQAVVLAILAVGVYNAEPLENKKEPVAGMKRMQKS